jgi:hypothetical protein
VRNLANPSRHPFTTNDITPLLSRCLQRDLGFRSRAAFVRWLTSDEVRQPWLEFKRDCLSRCDAARFLSEAHTQARINATFTTRGNRYRNRPKRQSIWHYFDGYRIECLQGEPRTVAWLAECSKWHDKREWDVNSHFAWFAVQVYARATPGCGPPRILSCREALAEEEKDHVCNLDAWGEDLGRVLLMLISIERRQPGWGSEDGGDVEELEGTEMYISWIARGQACSAGL